MKKLIAFIFLLTSSCEFGGVAFSANMSPTASQIVPNCSTWNGNLNCTMTNQQLVDNALDQLATIGSPRWGTIIGTLSSQTDLQTALNAKQNTITTGTTSQYLRGDLSLSTFPTNLSSFTNDVGYITGVNWSAIAGYATGKVLTATTGNGVNWQSSSGGSQTPWTSNINGGGYALSNVSSLNLNSALYVANYGAIGYGNDSSGIFGYGNSSTSDYLDLRTRATSRVYLNGSGDVGINNNSPAYPLDIKGNVQFSDGTNAAILETGSQSTYGAGSWIQSNHGPTAGGFFGMFDVNGGEMAFDLFGNGCVGLNFVGLGSGSFGFNGGCGGAQFIGDSSGNFTFNNVYTTNWNAISNYGNILNFQGTTGLFELGDISGNVNSTSIVIDDQSSYSAITSAIWLNASEVFTNEVAGGRGSSMNDLYLNFDSTSSTYVSNSTGQTYLYGSTIFLNTPVININGSNGIDGTKTLRNAAGTGTCTEIFAKGLLIGGTC